MTRGWVMRTALASVLLWPAAAAAQGAGQSGSPQLRVETIESGFVIAPDARFTEINDEFATLAGAYAGWLWEETLLVGGAAYWLANGDEDFSMAYAGPIVGVLVRGDRRIAFGARTLVGAGTATLSDTVLGFFGDASVFSLSRITRFGGRSRGSVFTGDTRVTFRDHFFIAEPQANLVVRLTDWMRLDAGFGYRFIAQSELMDERLKGVSGSIAVRLLR